MGKYIIELERGETAYKTVDSNGTPLIQLLTPTPYTEPNLEQVRKEAYEQGIVYGRMCEREKIFKILEKFSDGDIDIDCLTMGDFRTIMELSKHLQKMKESENG